jgi:hypothetical protein
MKYILNTIFVFLFSLGVFAQDKTTIPPGPSSVDVISKVDKKILQEKINTFFKKINEQNKLQCKSYNLQIKKKNLTELYLKIFMQDVSYSGCKECQAKENSEMPKHHPYVKCLFESKVVRETLKDVMDDRAYSSEVLDKSNSQDSFNQMNEYFLKLIKDYEKHED